MKKKILLLVIFTGILINCNSQILIDKQKIIHDLDSIRKAFHIPGVSFGVAGCDSIVIVGALGVREINTTDSVSINDYFHIASLGKGLTSFIIGKLVDEGNIAWDTRFFDIFPELKETSRKEYQNLDLEDLLTMRTTLRSLNDGSIQQTIDGYNEKYKNDRFSYYKFAEYGLTLEPVKYDSGQFYNYTSMGYILANLMINKASGLTYSQLLEKTNNDLGLNFIIGWPQVFNKDQPSGHLIPAESGFGEGDNLIVLNGDKFIDWAEDLLYYLTPSGHHSVTIVDYLKYLQLYLKGIRGQDNYLKASTYDIILNGAKVYSMGWENNIVNGNHYYSHDGSAAIYIANAIIIKESGIAISIMANAGNEETRLGLQQIIKYLEKKYAI